MDYELAKQLRDAGFPHIHELTEESVCFYAANDVDQDRHVCFPLLEELIEACGDNFWSLTRHIRGTSGIIWQTNWKEGIGGDTAGKTPKEAVARLYLSLYGNKETTEKTEE